MSLPRNYGNPPPSSSIPPWEVASLHPWGGKGWDPWLTFISWTDASLLPPRTDGSTLIPDAQLIASCQLRAEGDISSTEGKVALKIMGSCWKCMVITKFWTINSFIITMNLYKFALHAGPCHTLFGAFVVGIFVQPSPQGLMRSRKSPMVPKRQAVSRSTIGCCNLQSKIHLKLCKYQLIYIGNMETISLQRLEAWWQNSVDSAMY